ncbi:MAG: efflux RND transporter permease subunit, partial [Flavobacteriales bacterium]
MRQVIKFFVQHHIVGDLLMFAILVSGFVGMSSLRSNFFPEVDSKIVVIQVVYPGSSPEEIEKGIVAKIEENLQGVANIDLVTSTCIENAGSIVVEVKQSNKTDQALQDVKNAVDRIASFPVGMEPPIIFKQDPENVAIILAVSGVEDLYLLKKTARKIEEDLRSSNNISQILLSGFPEEEIEISVRDDRLSELGITVAQVAQAVRNTNIETTGGRIKTDKEELIVRGRFKDYSAEDLNDIVVRADRDGRIIRLSDVAEVRNRWADNDPTRNWYNGNPSVSITVNSLNSESILDVTEYVRAYVKAFNDREDVLEINIVRDQSVVLNQRIDLLVNNGIIGFLLVLLFLALFLNLRLAFWVALAIPVSFAGMFMFADMAGITINVVSLFGMILVIGILVDDGIVIAENIYRKYERGYSRMDATVEGTMEVLPAVFSAIVTTVIAFSAFFYIEG